MWNIFSPDLRSQLFKIIFKMYSKVRKRFAGDFYDGLVAKKEFVEVDGVHYYVIEYDDGDGEMISGEEVQSILVDE